MLSSRLRLILERNSETLLLGILISWFNAELSLNHDQDYVDSFADFLADVVTED
jgi:hypothetical protein